MYIFEIYHQTSKNLFKDFLGRKKSEMPESWRTTTIKTYPRFTSVPLPSPSTFPQPLSECIMGRVSCREFKNSITLKQVSSLLYYSIGEKDREYDDGVGRRMYPSGGARFPLEFYIFNFKNLETLQSGIYHYNIDKHALTLLKKIVFDVVLMKKVVAYDFASKAQFAVVFTSIFGRSSVKYRERAYRLILLEAGAVMQNFGLCAQALNIGSLNMSGLIDDTVEDLLEIDGSTESIVHSMFFG